MKHILTSNHKEVLLWSGEPDPRVAFICDAYMFLLGLPMIGVGVWIYVDHTRIYPEVGTPTLLSVLMLAGYGAWATLHPLLEVWKARRTVYMLTSKDLSGSTTGLFGKSRIWDPMDFSNIEVKRRLFDRGNVEFAIDARSDGKVMHTLTGVKDPDHVAQLLRDVRLAMARGDA